MGGGGGTIPSKWTVDEEGVALDQENVSQGHWIAERGSTCGT